MDKKKAERLNRDIEAALKEVARAHGVTLSVNGGRFTGVDFTPRITFTDVNDDGVNAKILKAMKDHNLTKMVDAQGNKLVDYHPNRYKYPFVMEQPDGRRYKLSSLSAEARFG